MPIPLSRCLVVLTALILASCEGRGAWPNLAEVPPEVKPGFQQQAATAPEPPPPPPSSAEALAAMARTTGAVTGLGARLEQHRGRFAQLQQDLGSQSDAINADLAAGKGNAPDDWSKAQSDLSQLNADVSTLRDLREDVGTDAAAGGGLVADLEPVARATLDANGKSQLENLRAALDKVLAGLGALDRQIADAQTHWQDLTAAQAARINTPPPRAAAAQPEPGTPAKPVVRKPRPAAAPALAAGPRDSGDRFKGRQPLVTLTFEDPHLDFETRLRGLIDKVRAQYPDIAFDIETIGAPPVQLGKVRALLNAQDIPNDVFVTPPPQGAAPAIKLYPR
jgi:hypothetical protein